MQICRDGFVREEEKNGPAPSVKIGENGADSFSVQLFQYG